MEAKFYVTYNLVTCELFVKNYNDIIWNIKTTEPAITLSSIIASSIAIQLEKRVAKNYYDLQEYTITIEEV